VPGPTHERRAGVDTNPMARPGHALLSVTRPLRLRVPWERPLSDAVRLYRAAGSPNESNTEPSKVTMSATFPSAMRSTSMASGV
jgi:hypothetical protein